MTDLTGDALQRGSITDALRAGISARTQSSAPAGAPRTATDLRAALAALPVTRLRRGYRPEAVQRMVEQVAAEITRRSNGEKPLLLAEHVHVNGVAMSSPGYAIEPTRTLLAAAAATLEP